MIRSTLAGWVFLSILVAVPFAGPARAVCDTAPPELTDFDFNPSAVNVLAVESESVTCNMTVSDDFAGVVEATCTFTSPLFFQQQSCTTTNLTGGTGRDGTFECDVSIPRFAESGTWSASVTLLDAVSNTASITSFALETAGLPASLTVNSVSDITPPNLSDFSFSPQAANVDAGPVTVSCEADLVDTDSGVDTLTCQFTSPSTLQTRSCSAEAPLSGTRNNGTFGCDVELPRYAEGGAWTARVNVLDKVGNAFAAESFLLQALGFPFELTVTSTTPDLLGPQLDDFSFTPTSVDVSTANATVRCMLEFSYTPAGIFFAGCWFQSPSQAQAAVCGVLDPVSGTPASGTYACDVPIPAYSEGGTWTATAFAQDVVGNLAAIQGADLGTLGFPSELDVFCGGDEEPTLRWDSSTTLAWWAIADATRYNVYRAALSAPGTDYGSCQNGRDANVTDLTFEETDALTPGQGFRFLVSATSGGVEGALGKRSDGLLRIVDEVCP
jgi:hypothetical protein